jgi:hypothetical protein
MVRRVPSADESNGGALRYNTGVMADPTPLTTQQLLRENFWLRELLEAQLGAIEARIDASDKAVKLLQAFADRTPTTMDVQHEVFALREVLSEKLAGVKTQISERDNQGDKATKVVEAAVANAFAAAKEVVNKSEGQFKEQINGITSQINTITKNYDDKIGGIAKSYEGQVGDIKERLTIIESKTSISDPSTAITLAKLDATVARLTSTGDVSSGRSAGAIALWGIILGCLGAAVSIGTLIVVAMSVMKAHG